MKLNFSLGFNKINVFHAIAKQPYFLSKNRNFRLNYQSLVKKKRYFTKPKIKSYYINN